jgi:hypothetical protein
MQHLLLAGLLLAHSWYSDKCCGGSHCHPVPCGAIHHLAQSRWQYRAPELGYDISFYTASPSPDEQCHACYSAGSANGLCLFLPQENV